MTPKRKDEKRKDPRSAKRKLTIRDIANMAGVSRSTISLAINDSPKVKKQTKQRILKIIEDVGYHPNVMARGLVGNKTNVIGLIVPQISHVFADYYFSETVSGVLDEVTQRNYHLLVEAATEQFVQMRSAHRLYEERRIDGLLFVGNLTTDTYILDLCEAGIPICLVNSVLPKLSTVLADNTEGSAEAVAHLYRKGHRRIGLIKGLDNVTTGVDRYYGYQLALARLGIPFDPKLVAFGNFSEESGYEAMRNLLRIQNPPTAVFTTNDMMAIGAMNAIQEKGLSVPGDIAIVGGDDIRLARYFKPSLTTIRQPMYSIGRMATDLLLKLINDDSEGPIKQMVKTELVVRESCGSKSEAAQGKLAMKTAKR